MKLQAIHEAKYAGDHPLVTKIKQAIKDDNTIDVVIEDPNKGQSAVDGIVRGFGKPDEVSDDPGANRVYAWNLEGHKLRCIMQDDRTIVELYAQGGSTSSLYQRMARRRAL